MIKNEVNHSVLSTPPPPQKGMLHQRMNIEDRMTKIIEIDKDEV